MSNPFTPAFGVSPFVLAGRADLLDDMKAAFAAGVGDPNLSTLIVGSRGTGKTALLTRIREEAQAQGWVAVGTTALEGMLEDIEQQAARAASHLVDAGAGARVTSIGIGPVSASWEREAGQLGNWRTRMTGLLDQLAESGSGLLVTVDEAQGGLDELVRLAAVYQHFVTEDRKVALVMAGLPFNVHQLVANRSVSFLRRSCLRELGRIDDADVAAAFERTFEFGGKSISDAALDLCVEAAKGFPYMLQLVGFRAWVASGDGAEVSEDHARRGIATAASEFEQRVLAATYRELSRGDLRFLSAMLQDPRESRLADISRRMGVASNYSTKYKSRLLAQGVIEEAGQNVFTFAIPGMRSYLETRLPEDGLLP